MYCAMGGSFERSAGSRFSTQTRSMIAAFQLLRLGYKVSVLGCGFQGWASSGREVMEVAD